MSDFLTRLAERTLGRARVIEPLLPGLWDSSVLPDGVVDEELTSSAQTTPATLASSGDTPTAPIGHRATTSTTGAPPAPASAPAPAPAPTLLDSPETPPPVSRRTSIERATEAERTEAFPARAMPASLVPQSPETSLLRERVEHTERIDLRASAVTPPSPAFESRPAAPRTLPESIPTLLPLMPRSVEGHEALRPAAAATPSAATTPPRVEITIGRIDVRATPRPASSRERRGGTEPVAPRQSLQDYLAAGSTEQGGGRP